MRRLTLALCLMLPSCALQLGPVGFAFGQASICRGPAESFYSSVTGALEQEVCQGGYVAGGAVSDTAGRATATVGRAVVRAGSALGGAPPPGADCPDC